jgi:hypothetical protein
MLYISGLNHYNLNCVFILNSQACSWYKYLHFLNFDHVTGLCDTIMITWVQALRGRCRSETMSRNCRLTIIMEMRLNKNVDGAIELQKTHFRKIHYTSGKLYYCGFHFAPFIGPVIRSDFSYIEEGESTVGYTFPHVWYILLALAYKESRFYVSSKGRNNRSIVTWPR